MARPIKEGLNYFPLDVDITQDDKIAMIEALHGNEGFAVTIKLLAKIYKEGYYYNWGKREQTLFAKGVNVDINTVNAIVNTAIDEGLFNQELYEKHEVLTSKGIQMRYLEAVKRRKEAKFDANLFLITDVAAILGTSKIAVLVVDANKNEINVNINSQAAGENANISTQSKEKKRKASNNNAQTDEEKAQIEQQFNAFWDLYAKKTDKKKAQQKFATKLKHFTFEEIMEGTKRYMHKCEVEGTDKKYIKGPVVFLNGDCFLEPHEIFKAKPKAAAKSKEINWDEV